jgi:1-acyl-sn-glycerol-3-phosphate acyltransferase
MVTASALADFYPPQLHPVLVRIVQAIVAPIAWWFYRLELEIDPDDLNQIQALAGKRRLLLPNHPTFQDPVVIFLLSAALGQSFYYLADYQQFQRLRGKFLPRLGAYSIRRGMADRPSITQTLALMSQPDCRLVIFPEGGCSFQNDTVMPLRVGGVQIAFQVLNRLIKQGEPLPDFYLVPISIKYRYTQNMAPMIQRSLHKLEQALAISPQGNHYERLRAIAANVLTNLEREYEFDPATVESQSWNDRIPALKSHILHQYEQQLALTAAPGEPDRERVYRIQHALQPPHNWPGTDSDEDLPQLGDWTQAPGQKAMFRLLNFDAIYDGYVAENPTPERFLDTLTRLEREVFAIDQPVPKGHRKAQIKIGKPINLKDFFEAYQKNRTSTINQVVMTIQQSLQQNLDRLNHDDYN